MWKAESAWCLAQVSNGAAVGESLPDTNAKSLIPQMGGFLLRLKESARPAISTGLLGRAVNGTFTTRLQWRNLGLNKWKTESGQTKPKKCIAIRNQKC